MPYDLFLAMLRASVIEELMATEEGQKHLETCERLAQTELDREGFRRRMNR